VPFPVDGGVFVGGPTTVVAPVEAPVAQPAPEPALVTAPQPIDLELVEVRQLDRGDMAKDLGPAYRVTVRNKTGEKVARAFNVALAASLGRQLTRDASFAMTRLDGLDAGQIATADIRMPAKAYKLGVNADGRSVPFAWLTAVVDSHQEIQQADRENDSTTLGRHEVAMVAQK
jgi:hypothetical protein